MTADAHDFKSRCIRCKHSVKQRLAWVVASIPQVPGRAMQWPTRNKNKLPLLPSDFLWTQLQENVWDSFLYMDNITVFQENDGEPSPKS